MGLLLWTGHGNQQFWGSGFGNQSLKCKTLKTSKMNDIVGVKRDKLIPYSRQTLQWINAGWENHHPLKRSLVEGMD